MFVRLFLAQKFFDVFAARTLWISSVDNLNDNIRRVENFVEFAPYAIRSAGAEERIWILDALVDFLIDEQRAILLLSILGGISLRRFGERREIGGGDCWPLSERSLAECSLETLRVGYVNALLLKTMPDLLIQNFNGKQTFAFSCNSEIGNLV